MSTAFGTFGELLQGVLPGPDGDFLVTLPIARWSMATFTIDLAARGVEVRPARKRKSLALAQMMLAATGSKLGGVLTIDSTLPEGKGMASSSADLVATARAVGNALTLDLSPSVIEGFLRRIEPTDGVLYPGIVAYYHRSVRLRGRLGSLPSMTIVGIDEGGILDTIEFNRLRKPFSAADRREYERLLDALGAAIAVRDVRAVGAIATRSAIMNQALRPKRALDAITAICAEVGGLGVVAAHSGTMLGVLLETRDPEYATKLAATVEACSALGEHVSLYRTLAFD